MATMGRTGGHQRGDLAAADGEVFMATVSDLRLRETVAGGRGAEERQPQISLGACEAGSP